MVLDMGGCHNPNFQTNQDEPRGCEEGWAYLTPNPATFEARWAARSILLFYALRSHESGSTNAQKRSHSRHLASLLLKRCRRHIHHS